MGPLAILRTQWASHMVPGIGFTIFGLWWHINNCIRHIKSLRNENDEESKEKQIKFEGSTTYPCFWLPFQVCRQWPIESILKIIITSIDFISNFHDGYRSQPKPHIEAFQAIHMPGLFGFFIGAWIEILVHYKVPLPKRITQFMAAMGFAMEVVVLVFHTHGETLLEGHIHQILSLTIGCSVIFAIGECLSPNNFSLIVARSFFALTQGTWFIQTAFVLWPPMANPYFTWKQDSHESVLYATMCYAYQLAFNSILLITLYLIIHKFLSHSNKLNPNQIHNAYRNEGYKLITDEYNEDI